MAISVVYRADCFSAWLERINIELDKDEGADLPSCLNSSLRYPI